MIIYKYIGLDADGQKVVVLKEVLDAKVEKIKLFRGPLPHKGYENSAYEEACEQLIKKR